MMISNKNECKKSQQIQNDIKGDLTFENFQINCSSMNGQFPLYIQEQKKLFFNAGFQAKSSGSFKKIYAKMMWSRAWQLMNFRFRLF